MAGEAAANLHAHRGRFEVELVVHDDDVGGIVDAIAAGELAGRLTRVVHVRQREGKHDALLTDARLGHDSVVAPRLEWVPWRVANSPTTCSPTL